MEGTARIRKKEPKLRNNIESYAVSAESKSMAPKAEAAPIPASVKTNGESKLAVCKVVFDLTVVERLDGRIVRAELRRRGLSTSAATWGGNQTAKDGGLDVRVSLPAGTKIDGFIPKADTGFQVKKPDMPRGEIIEEMKPKGAVRPVIAELAKASGAYIIISAAGSTADSALKSRRDAMAEAIQGITDADKLALDFFDRNRVATWVRDHAGMIP